MQTYEAGIKPASYVLRGGFFLSVLKQRLLRDIGRYCLERTRGEFFLQLLLLLDRKVCITAGIVDSDSGDYAVTTRHLSNGRKRSNMRDRDSCLVNFFYHRCSATCAASSRTYQDCTVHMRGKKSIRNFPAHALGILKEGKVACCRI